MRAKGNKKNNKKKSQKDNVCIVFIKNREMRKNYSYIIIYTCNNRVHIYINNIV